jgi:serine/threonine protein kinase
VVVPSKTKVLKCLDKWSDKIVTLVCIHSSVTEQLFYHYNQCQGLLTADELQKASSTFLKINDISYRTIPFQNGDNFVINREFMDCTLAQAFKIKTISFNDKIRIFYQICKIVSELEDAGVVHTNLNPNHILLSDDLQRVKLCGFNHAICAAGMTPTRRMLWQDSMRFIKSEDELYRPIELLLHTLGSYKTPEVTSAIDVWSLGCILGYMLRDGVCLFNPPTTVTPQPIYYYVFTTIGYPTVDQMTNGLNTYYDFGVQHHYKQTLQRLTKMIFPQDQTKSKWVELVYLMLNYFPKKRITIKDLLAHSAFEEHFSDHGPPGVFGTPPITLKWISIDLPEELWKQPPNYKKGYYQSLFGMRQALLEETRKDLIVLAFNLGNATLVPAELWINIFILANTNPLT